MTNIELTEKEALKALELLELCKEYHVFAYDGLLVRGLAVDIVKKFIKYKPSEKFRNWLIKIGLVIQEL